MANKSNVNNWQGDISYNGYAVDFAVLDSSEITSPKELDAHVIHLDGIDVSLGTFKGMFYPGGNTFLLNEQYSKDKAMLFKGQKVNGVGFKMLNFFSRAYGQDIGVEMNCLEPCSLMEITKQLTSYNSLTDFCQVSCSLSWAQMIEALFNKIPDNKASLKEHLIGSHNFRLSVRFHNANKAVKDVVVHFNYIVDFNGGAHEYDTTTVNPAAPTSDPHGNQAAWREILGVVKSLTDYEFKYNSNTLTITP